MQLIAHGLFKRRYVVRRLNSVEGRHLIGQSTRFEQGVMADRGEGCRCRHYGGERKDRREYPLHADHAPMDKGRTCNSISTYAPASDFEVIRWERRDEDCGSMCQGSRGLSMSVSERLHSFNATV